MFDWSYKFIAILIKSQVDGAERASSQLLLDLILIDPVYGSTIVLAVRVFRTSMKRLLHRFGA